MRRRFQKIVKVLKHAGKQYGQDYVSRMAAAIAYRTVFAIAPLLVIATSIAGFVLGENASARETLIESVSETVGSAFADAVREIVNTALDSAETAALVGTLLLLWSASTLFLELQKDLNEVFEFPLTDKKGFIVTLAQRGIGFLWTVGVGVALIGLFAVNAVTQLAGRNLSETLNLPEWIIGVLGALGSFGFMILLFGVVFQTLSFRKVPWNPVWVGAAFTATAFALTGYLTGLYFRLSGGGPTALGVSGSIVLLLFLAYLLSSVFLFGGQVTNSYWRLVYDHSNDDLVFQDEEPPDSRVETPSWPLSVTAVATFLVGLMVGRRKD